MPSAASRNVAWIGLGLIGLPMAGRLAAAGWRVAGFDIDPGRMALARERGIQSMSSLDAALEDANLVFTSLPNESALLDVAPRLAAAPLVVETSTIGPAVSAKVAGILKQSYVRAPISGSTNLAEAGALTTFVSGPKAAFESARPALAAYSRAQIWVGEGEEARYAKLAVNLMVAVSAGMMAESLALARRGGIAWETMLDILGESVVASPLVKYKLEPLRKRDFTPAATSALLMKDLDLIVKAARDAGLELPLAGQMQGLYRGLVGTPLEHEDFFSIVKLTE